MGERLCMDVCMCMFACVLERECVYLCIILHIAFACVHTSRIYYCYYALINT